MSGFPSIFWAGFGGALAGVLLTLIVITLSEWVHHLLDRRAVHVKLGIGQFLGDNEKQIFYQAANVDLKMVTLLSFGLMFKQKKWARLKIMPRQKDLLPCALGRGNVITSWSPMDELIVTLGEMGKVPKDLDSVWFEASSGAIFRRKIDKSIIEELEEAVLGKARELYADAHRGRILALGQQRESVEKTSILIR